MTFEDEDGYTRLHEAAIKGDPERVRSALAQGADLDAVTAYGWTAFDLACSAYASAHMGGAYGDPEKAGDYMACALALAGDDRERVISAVNYHSRNDCL